MKIASILLLSLLASLVNAQTKPDETAIRKILEQEVTTWNQGDADGYSRHFATEGTFTNVQGMFFTGYKAFRDRHEEIFKGQFRGTVLQVEVVSLQFVRPDCPFASVCTTGGGPALENPDTQVRASTTATVFARGYSRCWLKRATTGRSLCITMWT